MRSERLVGNEWLQSKAKRRFDIAVAAVATPLVVTPIAVSAAIFVVETGINPVFLQPRIDVDGEAFTIPKLRTIPVAKDLYDSSNGPDDERASRIGSFLRKTNIDEWPQIISILRGDMTVVGPRPLIAPDIERTLQVLNPTQQSEWLAARRLAKPGWYSRFGTVATSLGPQSVEYLKARAELDTLYAKEASLATDIDIINAHYSRVRSVPSIVLTTDSQIAS